MKLVADWRSAWRWHSTRILAVIAVLPLVWDSLPPDLVAVIPEAWRPWILAALAVAGVVGRLQDQGGANAE